jgi:hypothetical protein
LIYLERQICYGPEKKILFKKTIIWPWGQRSRSHKGHYGMQNTASWSCTHILALTSRSTNRFLKYFLVRAIAFLSFEIGQ